MLWADFGAGFSHYSKVEGVFWGVLRGKFSNEFDLKFRYQAIMSDSGGIAFRNRLRSKS